MKACEKRVFFKGHEVIFDTTPIRKKKKSEEPIEVSVIERIRNNETGEVRLYEATGFIFPPDTEPHWWYWEEGNMGCDCNREHHFGYAAGEPYRKAKCGDGRFSVNVEWNGVIGYREFE